MPYDKTTAAPNPSELATEASLGEKRSHDETVNVVTEEMSSKLKPVHATEQSNVGERIYLYVDEYDQPVVLEFDEAIMLGRVAAKVNEQPMVDLTQYGGVEKGVSRTHAVIQRMRNMVVLTDLGSMNKSYINGERIDSYRPYILHEGDEIRLGNFIATLHFRQQVEAKR